MRVTKSDKELNSNLLELGPRPGSGPRPKTRKNSIAAVGVRGKGRMSMEGRERSGGAFAREVESRLSQICAGCSRWSPVFVQVLVTRRWSAEGCTCTCSWTRGGVAAERRVQAELS